MQTVPEAPAPKTSRTKTIVLTVIATVFILGVVGTLIDQNEPASTSYTPVDSTYTPSEGFTLDVARLAWDSELTLSERTAICDFYNTPPVGTTSEMVQAFAGGAGISYAEADRVLDVLLAEEC